MEFKDSCEGVVTSELWYDVFEGGCIDPKMMLKNDEDIEKVCAAIETVMSFVREATDHGIIEVV
jgi:hypothetical protein